jgi:hypothetical protein
MVVGYVLGVRVYLLRSMVETPRVNRYLHFRSMYLCFRLNTVENLLSTER